MKKKLFAIILMLSLILLIASNVYASPDTYDSHPLSYTIVNIAAAVTNPTNAYDNNTGTSTDINYGKGPAGYYEVITFTTASWYSTLGYTISSVDFKMHYYADANTWGETYEILYYVGATAGTTTLQTPCGDSHALSTRTWTSVAEPNDGTWSWAEISNIKFRVAISAKSGSSSDTYIDVYEAWVTVNLTPPTAPDVSVDPTSQSVSAPFSIDINITNANNLYGWEFKLNYTTSFITATSVAVGPFLNNTAGTANTYGNVIELNDTYTATIGRVWVTQTMTGHRCGATGNGVLATIYFSADANGVATLDLHDVYLVGYNCTGDRSVYTITLGTVNDGSVTVTGAVPEFSLGLAMEIGLAVAVFYVWWRNKHKSKIVTKSSFIHR